MAPVPLTPARATPRELDAAAAANLATHMTWVQARTPGMRVAADDALTLADSGLACDTFNSVCRARLTPAEVRARVAGAVAYFAEAGRPFSWWVGPADEPASLGEALRDAGLAPAESELAMAADLDALAAAPRAPDALAPEGVRVVRVSAPQTLQDFAAISAANWTPPDPAVLAFYDAAAPALLAPAAPLRLYVGYLGTEAVAAAELTVGGGVAGLYNVSTREAFRRRGFGRALLLRALLDAHADGLRSAVLQAAPDGERLYAGLGFRPHGRYTEFQPPRSATAHRA